jgi:hypothetical protein
MWCRIPSSIRRRSPIRSFAIQRDRRTEVRVDRAKFWAHPAQALRRQCLGAARAVGPFRPGLDQLAAWASPAGPARSFASRCHHRPASRILICDCPHLCGSGETRRVLRSSPCHGLAEPLSGRVPCSGTRRRAWPDSRGRQETPCRGRSRVGSNRKRARGRPCPARTTTSTHGSHETAGWTQVDPAAWDGCPEGSGRGMSVLSVDEREARAACHRDGHGGHAREPSTTYPQRLLQHKVRA